MAVGNSDTTRRCDATCHKATAAKCVCVCGGRYHGSGNSKIAADRCASDVRAGVWGEALAEAAREIDDPLARHVIDMRELDDGSFAADSIRTRPRHRPRRTPRQTTLLEAASS
jgi:hypothetical protein